jgi:hypothetical protein
MKKFYILLILFVILTLAISACGNQQVATPEDTDAMSVVPAGGTVAEGHLKPEHAVNLSFLSIGVIEGTNPGTTRV